jgi:hypothetical protein
VNLDYVKYYNLFTDRIEDGYLVREDETYHYVCTPLCHEWLKRIKKLSAIIKINLTMLEKQYFKFLNMPVQIENPYSNGVDWVFEFVLSKEDFTLLNTVANFFEHFFYHQKKFDLLESLEKSVLPIRDFIPFSLMQRLIFHVLSQNKSVLDDRLQTLYSKILSPYLLS